MNQNKNSKSCKLVVLLMLMAVTACMLAGCAGNADTLASPSPALTTVPTVMPQGAGGMTNQPGNPLPGASGAPESSASPDTSAVSGGIMGLTDVQKASENMEDAIGQLSEVDDAYVIANGAQALIGLKLNKQYQGGVDERLQKMVLARVQTVDKAVSGIFVTAEEEPVKAIEKLSKDLDEATALDGITAQAEPLMQQLKRYPQ